MRDVTIRNAQSTDAPEISSLISALSHEFILTGSSAEERAPFLQSVSPSAIAGYLPENYRCHVAVHRGKIVGVIAVRDNTHLYHLFVENDYQHRGLATRLWDHAKRACEAHGNKGRYTVNASANALGFYERLGFAPTGPPVTKHGITFTPMELVRPPASALQPQGPAGE
jgi:ribosomal protein S18 acetylase RimI-like enzyme